ncbi:MAG: IS66 family transposase [Fusobacteriaceae bacterium]
MLLCIYKLFMEVKPLTNSELLEENKMLKEQIKILMIEIEMLKARLNMNSSNSSKPPSTDGFKKKLKTKSLRVKSNKSSGGQIGHKGSTLNKVLEPDSIIELAHDSCEHCQSDIKNIGVDEIKTRQIFDIPPIKIKVTEYRATSKICPHCARKSVAKFPDDVAQPTSYGPNIQSLILNLNVQQHLPYKRTQELLLDYFNLHISQGTIANILRRAYSKLEKIEKVIKDELINSETLHVDESGQRIESTLRWLFSFSNDKYTLYKSHKKRGKKALDDIDILPKYNGIVSHDCWSAYDRYNNYNHALCCAHLLRELVFIKEIEAFKFP